MLFLFHGWGINGIRVVGVRSLRGRDLRRVAAGLSHYGAIARGMNE